MSTSSDLVANWELLLPDGRHVVEFEHGTTSGKRVIYVNGKEISRQDWMFKLVGKEHFEVGKFAKCTVSIDACSGFAYEYTLEVNGKPLKKFKENRSKIQTCWVFTVGSEKNIPIRVVLEKNNMNVWVDGKQVETMGEFSSDCDATETHFVFGQHSGYIQAISSGNKRQGLIHKLFIDDVEIPKIDDEKD